MQGIRLGGCAGYVVVVAQDMWKWLSMICGGFMP